MATIDPNCKGHQNMLFRQMLKDFEPPAWVREIVVVADAGYSANRTLKLKEVQMDTRRYEMKWARIDSSVLLIIIPTMMIFANAIPTFAVEIFEADVALSPPAPAAVDVGTPVSATVDFEHGFVSIELVCFIFHFQDDLLDPGDFLSFTGPFGLDGAGFRNITPSPQGSRTLCFTANLHPETIALFLDGQQDFGIQMEAGSVIIETLTIQITGQDTVDVSVDIQPDSFRNHINLSSRGVISVAILTTATFDATTVDPLSVEFGPGQATEAHEKGHIEDADNDGDDDLVFHFRIQETGIQCRQTSVALTGVTEDGQEIDGEDVIVTVGCEK